MHSGLFLGFLFFLADLTLSQTNYKGSETESVCVCV